MHVLPDHLEAAGLTHGELCEIVAADQAGSALGYGIAWRATDRMGSAPKLRPVKMSDVLRNAFGIKEGSQVILARTKARKLRADKIALTDVTPTDYSNSPNEEDLASDISLWRCGYVLGRSASKSLIAPSNITDSDF